MARSAAFNGAVTINGVSSRERYSVSAENIRDYNRVLAAAIAGTLTTRTDNDTGIITTTTTGHGITASDFIIVAWLVGTVWTYRYNVDVTAVTSNTISIDIGSGTNLPIATTAVVVFKRTYDEMVVLCLPSTWNAYSFQSTANSLWIFEMSDNALDSPVVTTIPVVITKDTPLQFAEGMCRGFLNRSTLFYNGVTPGGGDAMLYRIHAYNLDTAGGNTLTGEILHPNT